MRYLQNLHTHSTFCDGRNTPEELVQEAIGKGFDSIGFSGHSYMDFSLMFADRGDLTKAYQQEIAGLKVKYDGVIDIFCGLEVDLCTTPDLSGYDYLIGGAHYFLINGTYVGFDRDAKTVQKVIDEWFSGDPMAYARAYYEFLGRMPEYGNFDIIAHFDLITKHCESASFLDVNAPEYLRLAFDTIDALKGKIPFFEVNTGAIARGYRKTPYPAVPILKRLLECGFLPIISSDCHDKAKLDCAFDDARELLIACGGTEQYVLTKSGFCAAAL